jgi:hypothetical protein
MWLFRGLILSLLYPFSHWFIPLSLSGRVPFLLMDDTSSSSFVFPDLLDWFSVFLFHAFRFPFSLFLLISQRVGRPGFEGIFSLFATASRPALGSTQPPNQWVPGVLSMGVKVAIHLHLVPRLRYQGAVPPLWYTSLGGGITLSKSIIYS